MMKLFTCDIHKERTLMTADESPPEGAMRLPPMPFSLSVDDSSPGLPSPSPSPQATDKATVSQAEIHSFGS